MPGATRSRKRFALALLIALLACLVWFFIRSGKLQAVDEIRSSRPEAPPVAAHELNAPLGLAATDARNPVPAPRADAPSPSAVATAPQQTRVFGSVLDRAGNVIKGVWWGNVLFSNAHGARQNVETKDTGTYEFLDLACGVYWVSVQADGYRSLNETFELRPESLVVHKDFVLQPANEVRVRVVTPEGLSLFDSLDSERAPMSARFVVPVATLERPGTRFDGIAGSLNNKFAVGNFWDYGPRAKALGRGYVGILVLDCEPPLYVSLVHYQSVLQTARVEPGQDEVTFVLSTKNLIADLATIQLRLVDAETGMAIALARVSLTGGSDDRSPGTTDAQGYATLAQLAPGRFSLWLIAENYEMLGQYVDALPGEVTDLGTIKVARGLTFTARVFDGEGQPSSTSFGFGIVDAVSDSISWLQELRVESGADGRLILPGLGQRQYVLRTKNHDPGGEADNIKRTTWVSGIVPVDLRNGPIDELEIRLKPATRLFLSLSNGADENLKFSVVDARGFQLVRSSFYEVQPRRLMLPPDRYQVSVFSPTGGTLSERSVVLGSETVQLDLSR